MKKRLLVLSLILAATLCISGCGKEKEINESGNVTVEASAGAGEASEDAASKVTASAQKDDKENSRESQTAEKESAADDKKNEAGNATATAKPDSGNSSAAATEAPKATQKPDTGNNEVETSKPNTTEKPATTQAPGGNGGTGATSTPKPAATQKPAATATPKPTATAKPGTTAIPKPAVTATPKPTQTPGIGVHTCVWNTGIITKAATCKEEGTMSYTCTVCNAVKTESIAKADHKYSTVNVSATCTEPGTVIVSCDTCGYINSYASSGNALGHDYVKQWTWGSAPTCSAGASYYEKCSRCGAIGDEGIEPSLPHTMEGTITFDGDCSDPTIVEYHCTVCGANGGYDYYYTDEHDFVEKLTPPYWSEEAQAFVQDTVVQCSRCSATP